MGRDLKSMLSKEQLLTTVYAKFNARDIDAVLSVMHPDVDWPNGMEGGRVHGHTVVRVYWERQWTIIDPNVAPIRIRKPDVRSTSAARIG